MTKPTHQTAHIIYPHQLFEEHFSFKKETLFILVEDDLFFTQYKFHKQKLLLHRLSMQAFQTSLEQKGWNVHYIESSQSRSSMATLKQVLTKYHISQVTCYELIDTWLEKRLKKVLLSLDIQTYRINSPGFLTTRGQIDEYFASNPHRMQQFYQWQRKRLNILVQDDKPVGGKWSFDQSNRKKLPKNIVLPPAYTLDSPDNLEDAKTWVRTQFADNPGNENMFHYPITHADATLWLTSFIQHRLQNFGPYEDAISSTEPVMFHSLLSPLLNTGLLTPAQVIDAVITTAPDDTPIESLEGFIRQVIGWREYMRATYVTYGSRMRTTNHLTFTKPLPKSWWNGTVGIEPIDTVIKHVLETGYSHHIERLMILGNSMVLLRIKPDDVYEWFMSMYIDAYDWVMVPNVYAMSQFAAGDLITTKPYVSGSNYIIKMSDYKKSDWSEIWDALYWQFIHDHRDMIEKNFRSAMVVRLYDRLDPDRKNHLATIAKQWLEAPSR